MREFKLGVVGLEEFEETVREISDLAFGYGIKKVGFFNPQSASKQRWQEFITACHEGYALAQKRIVDQLLQLEADLRLAKNKMKGARRERDKLEVEQLVERLKRLEHKRLVLHKIADGIAWTLFNGQRWVARRFFLGKQLPYLDATNLASVIAEVDQANRNPLSFALVSDITSFIQVGDIVKIDFDLSKKTSQLSIIEMKEGKVNTKVLEFLDSFYQTRGCPRAAWFFVQDEGMDVFKQAMRVAKQQIRGLQVQQVINTEKGVDLITGLHVLIPDQEIEEEDYDDVLRELVKTCKNRGYALSIIDDALWLGVFDASEIADPLSAFAHSIYHAIRPEKTCLLFGSENERESEFSEIRKSLYPIVDLRQGLSTPLSKPLFLRRIESETILDIIFGRIVVLTYLDFERLFDRSKSMGIAARWSTKEVSKLKTDRYFKHLGKVPIFQHEGKEVTMGDGIIVKMQLDGITVDSIIREVNALLRLVNEKSTKR